MEIYSFTKSQSLYFTRQTVRAAANAIIIVTTHRKPRELRKTWQNLWSLSLHSDLVLSTYLSRHQNRIASVSCLTLRVIILCKWPSDSNKIKHFLDPTSGLTTWVVTFNSLDTTQFDELPFIALPIPKQSIEHWDMRTSCSCSFCWPRSVSHSSFTESWEGKGGK